jgi:hypothetical protein
MAFLTSKRYLDLHYFPFAQVISNMTGRMRQQVPSLNGPAYTRFVADGVQGDSEATEEAKQLMDIATVR